MILSETAYTEYLDTHLNLLLFIGQKTKIVPANTKINAFKKFDLEIKFKCREALFEHIDLLDEYIASNVDHLSESQIKIINGFKKNVRSKFIVLKYLKDYAIFMDVKTNIFYASKALSNHFNNFFDTIPVLISTTLIPLNGKIIYDGFLQNQRLYFGKNIKQTLNEDYKKAKKENSIIVELDSYIKS